MKAIHIANTDFEFELAHPTSLPIQQALSQIPLCLQLQFLPLLYAQADEAIAVTSLPDPTFIDHLLSLGLWRSQQDLPTFIPLDTARTFPGLSCLSWGFSKRVQKWALDKHMHYAMPEWEVVQLINSKMFSFLESPPLEGSALLWQDKDLDNWLKHGQGRRVLKTCFGLSGRGNYLIHSETSREKIRQFCEKEWQQKRPVIAEPWLDRCFDFSTQWQIEQKGDIQLLGATVFTTDVKGTYTGTQAGPEDQLFQSYLPFLQEHKQIAAPLLEKIAAKGFFGAIGIDAFVYRNAQQNMCLRPIVEINGRKTMSVAALHFQKRWFPQRIIQLAFTPSNEISGFLLPTYLKGKQNVSFAKTLAFSFQASCV